MRLTDLQRRILLELSGHGPTARVPLSELASGVDHDGLEVRDAVNRLVIHDLMTLTSTPASHTGTWYASRPSLDPYVTLTWLGQDQLQRALEQPQVPAQVSAGKVQAELGWWRRQWVRGFARQDVWTAVVLLVLLVCALTEWAW